MEHSPLDLKLTPHAQIQMQAQMKNTTYAQRNRDQKHTETKNTQRNQTRDTYNAQTDSQDTYPDITQRPPQTPSETTDAFHRPSQQFYDVVVLYLKG